MKYVKLQCGNHYCECEFLIALTDWYNKEYEGQVREYYQCPVCDSLVFSEDDCIVEI